MISDKFEINFMRRSLGKVKTSAATVPYPKEKNPNHLIALSRE